MPDTRLLPIKVVFSRPDDYQTPVDAGGSIKFFGEFSEGLRIRLLGEVSDVGRHFTESFARWGNMPAVAKVKLKSQAVAKSHRPTEIFSADTCPVIGANDLGELYVSVSPQKLGALRNRIEAASSTRAKAQLTALEKITPFTPQDSIDRRALARMQSAIGQTGHVSNVRFRLFRHESSRENRLIDQAFVSLATSLQLKQFEPIHYSESTEVYRLKDVPLAALARLAAFPGAQSLSTFPQYQIVRTTSRVIGDVSSISLPPPDSGRDYGIVGVIDSGTDSANPFLQAWVVDRYDFVPTGVQDNGHGSFVAGLVAGGRRLNHNDDRFPNTPAKIVDVAALDRDGEIVEYDLLTVIDNALARFPYVRVWNLSLGLVGEPCADHEFSMLAAALDDRAEKHRVLFVIAAGNYSDRPLRQWPPVGVIDDRIRPPADAVRAITVGSIAHIDNPSSCVKREQPSPFTRRGPGPAYSLKPELGHYGGNCDSNGNYSQIGVISVDGKGHIAENIGTSFACPLVASIAANVSRELEVSEDSHSPTLVKALVVHSAFMRSAPLIRENVDYMGLGPPRNVDEILSCRQSAATVILQVPVHARPEFGKRPFPMPRCLESNGFLTGEVFMTLMYDPPMDRSYGIEYCRTNVNASLGTIWEDEEKKEKFKYYREIPPVPKAITEGYEEDLVKHGYKWSPLKMYHRKFSRGPVGAQWRLTLEMLNRAEMHGDHGQEVVVIVTIRSEDPAAKVYDELVRDMSKLNWAAQDLEIRSRTRIQS